MILDTNALSAFADGDPTILPLLAAASSQLALPAIVIGEYRYGISESRERDTYEAWLTNALCEFELLPVTPATTPYYAEIRQSLRKKGMPIPVNDLWIAALAQEHDLPIASRDTHFDNVTQIRRLAW